MTGEETHRFERDVLRMLLVFFTVAAVDLTVVSLLTGQLRLWFPAWVDPGWATDPASMVTYSQSYFAGIFFIPVLARIVDRDFLAAKGAAVRGGFWAAALGVLGFVLWWKGGLMVEHGKQREALGWLLLAAILWGVVGLAAALPRRARALGRRELLRRLMGGVAAFFLVMAVVDPLVQIGVQGLGWSTGLLVEVGFFVPAGLLLGWLSRRLRAPRARADGAPRAEAG